MMGEKPKPSMPKWWGNQGIKCPKCGARNRLGMVCDTCKKPLFDDWKVTSEGKSRSS